MEDRRKLILAIDFNNILYSSYYGEKLINSKGQNINAIKGFFFKIKSYIDSFMPDYLVFANDLSRKLTFRYKMYPEYKGKRKQKDDNILFQLANALKIIDLLGYPIINNELYEADDVLAMISRLSEDNNMDVVIVSSDRDLYQLVTDHTSILSPRKNDIITPEFIMYNYGLTADQWIELKVLQGDSSDNIPGVRGIGPTTAEELMRTYINIENIYNHLNELPDKLQKKLIGGKNDIEFTRKLVTIVTDYKLIDLKIKNFERGYIFANDVYKLISELEIPSIYDIINQYMIVGVQ